MRSIVLALLLAVSPAATALAQATPDPLATLNGRWVYSGHRDKQGLDQACKDHFEQYEVSADRRDIKTAGVKGAGKGYRVLYTEGNTAVMYLNDEERKLSTGDRIIWVLIVESQDRFRWRIYAQASNPGEEAKFARVRCPK
jgi:hypothetical protein